MLRSNATGVPIFAFAEDCAGDNSTFDHLYLSLLVFEPIFINTSLILSLSSFWRLPGCLCCFQHLCLQVGFTFLPSNNLTPSYSMVGSIGAIGVSLNLAPLLEVPSNVLKLHDRHRAQCQCQCQSFPPQKLGVVPVVVTSGERKGLGRSKYFAPCLNFPNSTDDVG